MLSRNDNGVDTDWSEPIVLNGYLALAVRTQPVNFLGETSFVQFFQNLVRQCDRQRHQFFSVVTCVTEHQPLVTSTIGINALCDVWALLVQFHNDFARIASDAGCRIGVANVSHNAADKFLNIDVCFRGNLSSDHSQFCSDHCLASHATGRVLLKHRVEYCVRDLVSQFVWMSHADRFACE